MVYLRWRVHMSILVPYILFSSLNSQSPVQHFTRMTKNLIVADSRLSKMPGPGS